MTEFERNAAQKGNTRGIYAVRDAPDTSRNSRNRRRLPPPPTPFSANLLTSPFHPLLCLRHNHAIFYWIVIINVISLWLTFQPLAQKVCKALSFI